MRANSPGSDTHSSKVMAWLDQFEENIPQLLLVVVAFCGLGTAPFWAGSYVYTLSLACIWAIFAMGWSILSGYTGYMSFGHTFISGTSAYTTALLLTYVNPDLTIAITLPISVIMAVIAGYLFALPSLRLKGPYFSLMTLVIVLVSIRLVYMFSGYTGGEFGLRIGTITYDPIEIFYFTFVPMVLVAIGLLAVSRSNLGMIFKAIKENEEAVESAGLNTTKFKMWSFTYSAISMGIGGVLIAHFYGLVDPGTVLAVGRNIEIISMAVIGGMGTIIGPIGGAFAFILLRDEILQSLLGSHTRYIVLWTIVLIIFFKYPDGIVKEVWDYIGNYGGGENE